jgi:hypothetical protein
MKKRILTTALILFGATFLYSQKTDEILASGEKKFDENKTKYSFKYDLLSEILQVGLDRGILKGTSNDVKLKSTLYGLMVIFDKKYEVDRHYSKLKFQRNFEIGGSMQINEDEQINGYGFSLKYAIINARDLSYGRDYSVLAKKVQETQQKLNNSIGKLMQEFGRKTTTVKRNQLIKFIGDNASVKDFDKFYHDLVKVMGTTPDDSTQNLLEDVQAVVDSINEEYKKITDEISKRPLLTIGFDGKNSESNWEYATVKVEFQKGLGFVKSDEHPWDLYLASELNFTNDSLSTSNKLNRSVFSAKGGINHVLIKKQNNQSFLEVLGGFEYNSIFKGKYPSEKTSVLNAMFNLTFRIAPNLYLPVELKYDPESSRFMGHVRIKWDMVRDSE